MAVNNRSKSNGTSRKPVKLIGAAVLVAAVAVVVVWLRVVRADEDPMASMATFVAKRGPLTISVLESGAIKAKEQEIIRNEVEGRSTIISIIPEGTRVQEGDVLVELDVSSLSDNRIDQEIRVQNADASYINATESLAITRSQAQSDIDVATLELRFAKLDLEKYTDPNGQYRNDLASANNDITLAQEELTRAEETLTWSSRLYDEKYLSKTELQGDELTRNRSKVKLVVAQNNLELLEKFTYVQKLEQLKSDVKQAEMKLQRTEAKARANIVQAEADLKAKEQELSRQRDKLQKIDDQLAKAVIISPAEGMVVYATSSLGGFGRDDRRPLADGVEVFQRQELIYIPKSSSSVAEVDVHEASLDKVRPGLPAMVTIDALPGKKFIGTVERIAPLPNAQSMWMNPDLKVYTTNINLETNDPGLRSGMSCKAEIIVAQHRDVVHVPVQAVLRVGGQPTVFVVQNGQVQERKVEIGLDNNSMIVIHSGLEAGEVVLLTPPLRAATLEPGERVGDANDTTAQRINEKLKAADEMQTSQPLLPRRQRTQTPMVPGVGEPGEGQQGGQGLQTPSAEQLQRFQSMTPEEREKAMEERLQSMTPEQREQAEQMRQRLQNMSQEERDQMRQQRRGGGGEGGGGEGGGRRPGGEGRRRDAGSDSGPPQGGR
jgi:HlyD family secretion protein